jgi:hypothetical protein
MHFCERSREGPGHLDTVGELYGSKDMRIIAADGMDHRKVASMDTFRVPYLTFITTACKTRVICFNGNASVKNVHGAVRGDSVSSSQRAEIQSDLRQTSGTVRGCRTSSDHGDEVAEMLSGGSNSAV